MMPSPNDTIYESQRISQLSKIMPAFAQHAEVGDEVMMGIEGDIAFPYSYGDRPQGKITDIRRDESGKSFTITFPNGQKQDVHQSTISPSHVFEFTDSTFNNILTRTQNNYLASARAEERLQEPKYAGVDEMRSLQAQVQELQTQLEAEKKLNRSFHNTYVMTMDQVASDIVRMDTNAKAEFARIFTKEFKKMQSRAENKIYRGSAQQEDVDSLAFDDAESLYSQDGAMSEFF